VCLKIAVAFGHAAVYKLHMEKVSPDYLRARLRYEPETGLLFWRVRDASHFIEGRVKSASAANRFNANFANKEAFTSLSFGYKISNVNNQHIKAHRAAWAIHYGEWPEGLIDHINRDRADNRIINLRVVSRHENNSNVSSAKGSSSKYVGVYFAPNKRKPWIANIKVNRKSKYLGGYATEDEAGEAYNIAASAAYGQHATKNDIKTKR
jgi:hypothetical protein